MSLFPSLFAPFDTTVLLSARENLYQFVSLLLLFKMMCMGISMYVFASGFRISRGYKILAGVSYGLCSCTLIHYQIGTVMLDVAILFPLLMLGFYHLLEREKALPYILLLALCMGRSFYVSCMICLYSFFAAGAYFYCRGGISRHARKCRLFLVSMMSAMLLSSISWLPAMLNLAESARTAMVTQKSFLGMYLAALSGDSDFRPVVFLMYGVCILMGSSFWIAIITKAWHGLKGELSYYRAIFLLVILAIFVSGTETLYHGGSRMMWPVRFAFIPAFVFIEIGLTSIREKLVFPDGAASQKWREVLLSAGIIGCIGCSVLGLAMEFSQYLGGIMFVTAAAFVICCLLQRFCLHSPACKPPLILLVLLVEYGIALYLWLPPPMEKMTASPRQHTPDWHQEEYNRYLFTATDLKRELDGHLPDSLRTLPALHTTRNADNNFNSLYAALAGTCSLENFIPSCPSRVQRQYAALGYGYDYTRVLDSGGTLFSDALLHITNVFTVDMPLSPEFYSEDASIRSVHWYRPHYTLPFGLEIADDAPPCDNVFAYQNHIFHLLAGDGENLLTVCENQSGPRMEISVAGRQELYFYSDNRGYDTIHRIYVNGKIHPVPNLTDSDNTSYPKEFNNRLLDLGTFEDEMVTLELETVEDYDFSQVHLGLLDVKKLASFCESFPASLQEPPEITKDSLFLRHDSPKGGILFLPITYYQNWHCMVNGEKTEPRPVFGSFLGVPVRAGGNDIQLKYEPLPMAVFPYWGLAAAVWAAAWAGRRQLAAIGDRVDDSIGKCYMLLWWSALAVVYAIPFLFAVHWTLAE